MSKQSSFTRKVIYGGIIFVLLIPLAILGQPATFTQPQGGRFSLARQKLENGLSQANLGEIDPASETMKLVTLGLRGVAVNLLWNKADEYKKKEDWTNLTATLEQLALLQPNFITFWKYQSWNVSYNVSTQFDDYRDRYYYVRQGIQFLEEGVKKNRENRDIPQLLWDLGWFTGHKIGRADERVEYRRLFKNDDEFHGDDVPPGSDLRDNWLVSKREYLNGVAAIQDRGKSIGKKSETIYYSSPAKSQMSYAEAIEEEGSFEKGQDAWKIAADDWKDFGDRPVMHSTGRELRLGHEDDLAARVEELEGKLREIVPDLREQMVEEERAKLTDEERAALDASTEERTPAQWEMLQELQPRVEISDQELIERIAQDHPELRKEAGIVVRQLAETRTDLIFTQRYKENANYDYWKLRADFEQSETAVEARRKVFEAEQAYRNDQSAERAKALYEEGFDKWRELLEQYPELQSEDNVTGDDILQFILDYRSVLRQLDEQIPDDFVLWDIIEKFDVEQDFIDELREHQQRMGGSAEGDQSEDAEADDAEPDEAQSPSSDREESDQPTAEDSGEAASDTAGSEEQAVSEEAESTESQESVDEGAATESPSESDGSTPDVDEASSAASST